MAEDSPDPPFTADQETATFLASCEILSKAWEESQLVGNGESFRLHEHEGFLYVAFSSFLERESFIDEEGDIQTNNRVFSDSLKGNHDEPALVHQGALKLFLDIMVKTNFRAEMQIYTDSKQWKLKPIVFVGHSLGGAVATLATLWVLEKRLWGSIPFCITFGCPLVGDERLDEAVARENWTGKFLHVVSKHDIVPRMFLAPVESIAEPLTVILPYWHGKVADSSIQDSSIQDSCKTLLENVLQYTSTVASLSVSDRVTKTSPYRAFGTYMFCSSEGGTCIDDSEIVLQTLRSTLQNPEGFSPSIIRNCFLEHIMYGSILKKVIEKSISGRRTVNPDSESSYQMGISLQLEAIGLGASGAENNLARLFLRRERNAKNTNVAWLNIELHLNESAIEENDADEERCDREGVTYYDSSTKDGRMDIEDRIELHPKQGAIAEIERYRERCEREGVTYYDSSTKHGRMDIEANLCRVKLALFWDEIIEMWENHELPSDFQSQNKWINAGNRYRELVEPLDIAYYYQTNSNGNYLSDGRHNRHKVLQKWMEEKEKTRRLRGWRPRTPDSCLWAHVEEARKDMENLKQGQHESLQKLEMFEEYVTKMEESLGISSDVFLPGSRFTMWWEDWKEYNKNQSPDWSSRLCEIMKSRTM